MKVSVVLLASSILVPAGFGSAWAGPCSDQIADLSRLTSGGASPTTTGAVSSPGAAATAPGSGKQTADQRSGTREMSAVAGQVATSPEDVRRQQQGQPTAAQAADPAAAGGAGTAGAAATAPGSGKQTADQRSGTREMSAVAGQVATSPEDVRRQQEGQPTMAQAADPGGARLATAKAKLEQARLLDQQGNVDCMALVNEARAALAAK